jgi:hypothetical protein
MPVRTFRLGEEPDDDLSAESTPDERLAMVAVLSARMWTLTGKPLATYERSTMPVRMRRVGDEPVQ